MVLVKLKQHTPLAFIGSKNKNNSACHVNRFQQNVLPKRLILMTLNMNFKKCFMFIIHHGLYPPCYS